MQEGEVGGGVDLVEAAEEELEWAMLSGDSSAIAEAKQILAKALGQ